MSVDPSRAGGAPAPSVGRLGLAALAALAAGGILGPGAPRALEADAPPERFSAGRAMALLEELAHEPHPLDSEANDRVRARIERQLEELGIPWERQPWSDELLARAGGPTLEAQGVNLLARLPAAEEDAGGPVALFVVHYDSRPGRHPSPPPGAGAGTPDQRVPLRSLDRAEGGAPGAGDDGAALAAFLEALRALQADPAPANELWFLFTDGEEYGLLGAEAFAQRAGSLERVAVVLNFEGRGNGGPVVLFETGRDDAPWLAAYAAAVRWPQASSLGPTAYEYLPNDTDFSVFRRRGLPGLNFAFIGGGSAYHQPWDTPANLDPRSVQHHGEVVLGLARHLRDADLTGLAEEQGRATFFTLPGNVLVRYPRSWEPVFALIAALATAGALAFGLRSQALHARGVLLAVLAWPVLTALLAVATLAVAWLVDRGVSSALVALGATTDVVPRGNLASGTWTTLGVVGCVGLCAVALARGTRRTWSETLSAGAVVGWSSLALVSALTVPGCAHAFTWPALFSALGLHAALRARVLGITGPSAWVGPLLACLPVLLVLLPVIKLLAQVGSVTPLGAVVIGSAPAALVLGLLLPALRPLVASSPRLAQVGAWAAALGPLAAGAALAALGR
jgi:hypothetical protein